MGIVQSHNELTILHPSFPYPGGRTMRWKPGFSPCPVTIHRAATLWCSPAALMMLTQCRSSSTETSRRTQTFSVYGWGWTSEDAKGPQEKVRRFLPGKGWRCGTSWFILSFLIMFSTPHSQTHHPTGLTGLSWKDLKTLRKPLQICVVLLIYTFLGSYRKY